ncbi:neuropeptide FF receptor 2-like [Glandiceps talaboti]
MEAASNVTTPVSLFKNGALITTVYIVSYLLIFLLCLIGNTLVCLIVMRNPRMHTVTNFFIVNLAVADVLVSIFCMPITLVTNIVKGWPFGLVMCKLTPVIQGISVAASIFTLTVIAIDRHENITNPLRPRMEFRTACRCVLVIWILSVAIMVPQGIVLQLGTWELQPGRWLYYCSERQWPTVWYRHAYTGASFLLTYLAPLIAITIAYLRIAMQVWTRHLPGVSEQTQASAHANVSKQKIKVIKMILVVVILFSVSWLPLHICVLLSEFGNLRDDQMQIIVLYVVPFAHWLAYFNSSVNPIVYSYYNKNFRRGFRIAMHPTLFCKSFGSVREPWSGPQETPVSGPQETDRLRP